MSWDLPRGAAEHRVTCDHCGESRVYLDDACHCRDCACGHAHDEGDDWCPECEACAECCDCGREVSDDL